MLLVVVAGVLILGLDAWRSYSGRSIEIAHSNIETTNLAMLLAQETHQLVSGADALVAATRERLEAGGQNPAALQRAYWAMYARIIDLPALSGLFVADANGTWIAPPPAVDPPDFDPAGRAILDDHRADPSRDLKISRPLRNRADGSWVLVLSRRVDNPDRSFGGVVLATMSVIDLENSFEKVDVGPEGAINLALTSGAGLVRLSGGRTTIGADLSSSDVFRSRVRISAAGLYQQTNIIDGVARIGSFRQLDDYPLVILVAHSRDAVLAGWRADAGLHLLISSAVTGLIGLLVHRFARQLAARHDAEERYRLLAHHSRDVILCLNMKGERLFVSPSFSTLTGWSESESLSGLPGQFIYHEDSWLLRQLIARLKAGSPVESPIYRYNRSDGSQIWVEGHFQLVAAANGQEARIIGNVRDISKRKAAEEKLAAANRELSAQASTDGLTGLANRRRLDETLPQEWARAKRDGTPLSLLLIDIDRFKAFNDRYGHQDGDQCLCAIARAVAGCARRAGDLAARYGGEELALVLPDTDQAGAARIAEYVRAAIKATAVTHAGNPPYGVVTASIGIATTRPAANDGSSIEELVAMADGGLYEAKRGGRNRAVVQSALPVALLAPAAGDEAARLASLGHYARAIAAAPAGRLDGVARLAASLFDAPIAAVSFVGARQVDFAGRFGLEATQARRDVSFCAHTVLGEGVFQVSDAAADARFAQNPFVVDAPHARFYAGAPLVSPVDGQRIGALCLIDQVPRPPLDPSQKALLSDLAALVMNHLEHQCLELPSAPVRQGYALDLDLAAGPPFDS